MQTQASIKLLFQSLLVAVGLLAPSGNSQAWVIASASVQSSSKLLQFNLN